MVVATPIGNIGDLSPRAAATLQEADVVCCEDTRHTGQLLARLGLRASRLLSVHAHNERERVAEVLEMLERGARVALVSDAGTPAVSDPGEMVISAAIAAGHKVTTVPGPSAAVSALVVAGLGTARWRFEGFLPRRGTERGKRLGEIAAAPHPSVIYESPQRISCDAAGSCELLRRRPEGGGLPGADEAFRGDLARDTRRGVRAQRGDARHAVSTCSSLRPRRLPSGRRRARREVQSAVASRMSAGASRRQAAAEVAADLGVSKRFAYETSLARNGQ